MLSYDRAMEIVSNYIADMQFKDRRAEIEWLLKKAYKTKDRLIKEWDLENRDIWKIKEYVNEEDIHKTHSSD